MEIVEAYVGLHWEWQEYGAPWQVNEEKSDRWDQDILNKGITREVTTSDGQKGPKSLYLLPLIMSTKKLTSPLQGLDDIEISGSDYLADLRAFRNEISARKAFWRRTLLGKKIVLNSDPTAGSPKVSIPMLRLYILSINAIKQTINFEQLPEGIENCLIFANGTPRPVDFQFRPQRVMMRLDKDDVVAQVEIG